MSDTTAPAMPAPMPIAPDLARHWLLDPAITYLNHGSFGATPKPVLDRQTAWRRQFEERPIEMLDRRRNELLAEARQAVGRFLGAAADDLAFVTNATEGANSVLRSMRVDPGDELLSTNHVYNAVRQTMRHVAGRAGATYRQIDVPLPTASARSIVQTIEAALTDRTRLLLIDHISSPTAVVFPVKQIIDLCAGRGVEVFVDGAHAPGMLDLDIESLGASYYTGNLHKWVCAPKGAGFLWVRRDKQDGVHPASISHFYQEGFVEEFNWQGTRDISAWLSAPDAIEFMAGLGWDAVRQYNHELAVWVNAMLSQRWLVEPATPADGSLIGSMATVQLPEASCRNFQTIAELQARLYDHDFIEVPVIEWGERWWVRPCCQVYNTADDYEKLSQAVLGLA